MGNQQLYDLTNEQLQVLLSGILGDGHITDLNTRNSYFQTSCKYEEYINYKIQLLGNLFINKTIRLKNGYAQTPIYIMRTKSDKQITKLKNITLKEILDKLDNLGIALWFYDDGSLHKNKLFYNLNTHSFSKKEQEELIIPFFNKFNIFPKLTKETKKDGRKFYYLRISKFEGAYEINKILHKYQINCYKYKLWSSETIQQWSKLQVQLKNRGISVSNKRFSNLLKVYNENHDMQDIVRSLEKSKAGVIPLKA